MGVAEDGVARHRPVPGVALVTVVVPSYDEALAFYVGVLVFALLEDIPVERGKRRVVVAPRESRGAALLLAQAKAAGSGSASATRRVAGRPCSS